MISRIYRLVDTKRIEMVQREVKTYKNSILVKPEHMSICAADQRYYLGKRNKEVLDKKLPMALIHEATGIVLHDFGGQFHKGDKVVLIPLVADDSNSLVKSNYRKNSKFASSGVDGFMQDIIVMSRDRLIPIKSDYSVIYVFSELMSVALNAIQAFESLCHIGKDSFGIWGDGSMGLIMSLALRCLYPSSDIYVIGKNVRKLRLFSFATKTLLIDQIPDNFHISHGFECVGNTGSEAALKQIIDLVSPQGCVCLLGVSEESVSISTRKVLDKGLVLIGNNRSDANDFRRAVSLIQNNELCQRYLQMLISETIEINTENDITNAFEQDVLNDFKTVIKWSI